jgi:predicted phosphodiesterase
MKIQPISDLHLDCLNSGNADGLIADLVNPTADVVILAGDMCESDYIPNLKRQLDVIYKPIIYVAGNHEYWNAECTNFYKWLKQEFINHKHVTILDKEWVIIDDVMFLGGTLWTDLSNPVVRNSVEVYMNRDFSRIQGMKSYWWHKEHMDTREFIQTTLQNPSFDNLKKVVITHHGPSFNTIPNKFKWDSGNGGYQSNLDWMMCELWSPDIWIHGHSHEFLDKYLGNTRVVRNPRGYTDYGENDTLFDKNFLIDTEELRDFTKIATDFEDLFK